MKIAYAFATVLIAAGSLMPVAHAEVNASLDRDAIGSGDTVTLTLLHDGRSSDQPDLRPLDKDFDILGRSSGSSIQIVNGHMSSQTQLQLTLSPKHSGQLQIPVIRWGSDQSAPLQLNVSGGGAAPANPGGSSGDAGAVSPHVFLTSSLESAQPYVQAADILTVRLYTDEPLRQGSLDLLANNDISVQLLGKDQSGMEARNGRQFHVIERKYLLVPQRSGTLQLDGPVLDAQVVDTNGDHSLFGSDPFAGMIGVTRPIRLHGDPIHLQVRARPSTLKGLDWIPAQSFVMQESFKPDGGAIHAGDPVTLHLHLSAQGVPAATLPDLSGRLNLPDGLKAYPDQAKLDTEPQDDTVIGTRDQDIAVIASRSGHFAIPALRVTWWDTAKNVARDAEVLARSLDILSAAPGTVAQPAATTVRVPLAQTNAATGGPAPPKLEVPAPLSTVAQSNVLPWKLTSLALALLWLVTVLAWWRGSCRQSAVATAPKEDVQKLLSASEAFKAFHQACSQDDAVAARRYLLAWARVFWPTNPPIGVSTLAERLGDAQLHALFQQLDRACYAGSEWRGAALAQTFRAPPAVKSARTATLADLYP